MGHIHDTCPRRCDRRDRGHRARGEAQKGQAPLLPPRDWVTEALAAYARRELPISPVIAALAPEVDVLHADPCDPMIVATARLQGIPVITSDSLISACKDIEVIW
jgi:PIN domain nuclease of toxin-antitoxin system